MQNTIAGMKRTHMCGVLREGDVGARATLMGWVDTRRDLGQLIFVDLRDKTGIMQVVFDASKLGELFHAAETLRSEYVIALSGEIVLRDEETVNTKLDTGRVEIKVDDFRILSKAQTPPFYLQDGVNVNENVRLKYRYLDLRRPEMIKAMQLRHDMAKVTREYLDENGFMEIETPVLTKSTPEGARDYLVPSRVHPGAFYALPQSPQLFKQILMVAGVDRYYQIARCFRDEDLRADRQPEFTQIDMELSFVDADDVMEVNEGLIRKLFKESIGYELPNPLPRLTYKEAMERYGSDRPDTRFGFELKSLNDILAKTEFKVFAQAIEKGGSVRCVNAKGCGAKFARREIDALVEFVKIYKAKGMAWINVAEDGLKSPITKFMTEEEVDSILSRMDAEVGDILFFVADKDSIVFDSLGNLRLELARKLDLLDNNVYNALWVTEFPLLEYDEAEKRYTAIHHPFTAPMDEDIPLLETEPQKVRAKAYDIVVNGTELGGGSIRIHSVELQERMFKLLGFTQEDAWARFGYLMEAFKYGPPPHGGLAYGFDRLVMLLAKRSSIRDVIAFPKVQNASCPLSHAPDTVDAQQLEELHIAVELPEEE